MNDMDQIPSEIQDKIDHMQRILREMGTVLVAFSGGVDSSLLLKVAWDVLGDRVLGVTALSETTPDQEKRDAAEFARSLGVRYQTVISHELTIPSFIENPPDKCYICKKSRFGVLVGMAAEQQISWVVDGENIDDAADYRPGSRAARELGVRSPLREAGLTKGDIRRWSKHLGLSTWEKPALACLASRIPYGHPITAEKLKQVDAGESFIRGLGLTRQVRLRHEGDTVRIEVDAEAIDRLMETDVRQQVVSRLKSLGFSFVALDMEGYSTGRLNRVLETDPDWKGEPRAKGVANG